MSGPVHRWVQGQSGNPGGRAKIPDELRDIKAYQGEEVRRLIAKTGRMTTFEQLDALSRGDVSVFEKALIKCWQFAVEKGDAMRLEFLLNRTIGRAPLADPIEDASGRVTVTPEAAALLTAGLKEALKAG